MASETVSVSFEFFPPGDDAAAGHLWDAVLRLAPLRPKFVSVTYGADGSTRSNARVRNADIEEHRAHRGPASDMHRRAPRRSDRNCAGLLAPGRAAHGGAPRGCRRPASPSGRTRAVSPSAPDLRARLEKRRALRYFRRRLPRGPPESGTVEADLENLSAKSTQAPIARSRNSSSTRTCSCAIEIGAQPPEFVRPSCPASCRSRGSPKCCVRRNVAGPSVPRLAVARVSTASTRIPRPGG